MAVPHRALFVTAALAAAGAAVILLSAQADPVGARLASRFTKREVLVPMRDGVALHTAIYEPRCVDAGTAPRSATGPGGATRCPALPILLTRTPYGIAPYGDGDFPDTLGPSSLFDDGRFVIVHQDVRGRFMSEGEWVEMRPIDAADRGPGATDESTDTWDTIEWLLAHVTRANGRVGTWGVSYPGFYVSAGLVGSHPALVAASPQAPVTDYYLGDDAYHNGAFMLAANFGFYAFFPARDGGPSARRPSTPFDYGTDDGYRFFLSMGPLANANARYFRGRNPYWNEVIGHPDYDEFWKARSVTPRLRAVRAAVLTVGGWYDAEDLQGPLRVYQRIERTSPASVNRLVMGPWTHGGWIRGIDRHAFDVGSDTGAFYRERIERPFFERALLDGAPEREPEAWMFETGRDEWRSLDAWPPKTVTPRTFWFLAGGRLGSAPPVAADAFDEYVSDPRSPVPYVEPAPAHVPAGWMTFDQRFAERRPDVLVYRGDPLADDLTVAGPVRVRLHVSTSGTDSDFVVKLIDESPGRTGHVEKNALPPGYQRLVRGEPFRGRYRRGFDRPEPFRPGVPDTIEFAMPDVFHTFRRGHRVVVHVQSSWFPLTDLNPQTFVRIPDAREQDFKVATERVYRSATGASGVTVGVIR